jgi:hypothetical protein
MRIMENATVRRALGQILRDEVSLEQPMEVGYEAMSCEIEIETV